ncbi:MAG TPA: hypothetical protein DCE41_32540 [Cytophagales bacterium]|nr:hypothetical protein [Cytophagales bacterium]
MKRAQNTDGLVWWGSWINEDNYAPFDIMPFVEGLDSPEDPNALLAEATTLLLGLELDSSSMDQLKLVLLSGQQGDYIWTDAWNAYQADPSESNRSVLDNRLKPTFQTILQLGEAQLM